MIDLFYRKLSKPTLYDNRWQTIDQDSIHIYHSKVSPTISFLMMILHQLFMIPVTAETHTEIDHPSTGIGNL